MTKKLSVGGQAVIEGVMMRGPGKIAVAVRKPNGEITVDLKDAGSVSDRYPILKKPFLRGVVSLVESLSYGMKALSFSAQASGEEDEGEESMSSLELAGTIAVSVGLAVLLFVVLPTGAMKLLQNEGFSSSTTGRNTRPSIPMNTGCPCGWRTCGPFPLSIPGAAPIS